MAATGAGERRRFRAWPLWAVIGLLLALGFWLLGQRWTRTGKAPTSTTLPTSDSIEITARVDEVAPSRAFWINLDDGRRLLVLPIERDTPMDAVGHGEILSITGRLEKPASRDLIVREWNLDPRTAAILAREPVYLRAERIRPAAKGMKTR